MDLKFTIQADSGEDGRGREEYRVQNSKASIAGNIMEERGKSRQGELYTVLWRRRKTEEEWDRIQQAVC